MIKRVVKITSGIEFVVDKINDFISNDLKENEYVIDIKYIKDGSRLRPYEKGRADVFETVVIAIVHIGELNNESS
jgi:hypothetical protein|uniref:Uncharacterized protein n=1 Tax=Siphoviridae sp. ctSP74 TaxID=2826343 RepID=A0A8S5NQH9_9CAUD|nr:MAG TPA: hypothetical protein [Siphoviridae sp. ctSP74]